MRFGVNYTPSHGWFHTWLNPDWQAIGRDLDQIASLGADHIRVFPLWPILQPNRTMINRQGLDDLHQMVDMAGQRGLDSFVDVIQGHLSSFDFLPSWVTTWHARNIFTDEPTVQAEADLIFQVYRSLEDLDGFRGLTVGNECNQFLGTAHPLGMTATSEQIEAWIDALISPLTARAEQDHRILVHSEDDAVWYLPGHAFNPVQQGHIGSLSTVHAWVFNGVASKYGPVSPECLNHGRYLIELAKAYEDQAHRQVWAQEIGAPLNVMTAAQAPTFMQESVRRMAQAEDLFGITWWCSHDVNRGLADFPDLEYDLGLIDQEGQVKELGRLFASLAEEIHSLPNDRQDDGDANRDRVAIVLPSDPEGMSQIRSACAPGGRIFEAWMNDADSGESPLFTNQDRANDTAYLAERRIARLVPAESL